MLVCFSGMTNRLRNYTRFVDTTLPNSIPSISMSSIWTKREHGSKTSTWVTYSVESSIFLQIPLLLLNIFASRDQTLIWHIFLLFIAFMVFFRVLFVDFLFEFLSSSPSVCVSIAFASLLSFLVELNCFSFISLHRDVLVFFCLLVSETQLIGRLF